MFSKIVGSRRRCTLVCRHLASRNVFNRGLNMRSSVVLKDQKLATRCSLRPACRVPWCRVFCVQCKNPDGADQAPREPCFAFVAHVRSTQQIAAQIGGRSCWRSRRSSGQRSRASERPPLPAHLSRHANSHAQRAHDQGLPSTRLQLHVPACCGCFQPAGMSGVTVSDRDSSH